MSHILETDRLLIRDYELADGNEALHYLGDQGTMYYLPEAPFDKKTVGKFIEKAILEKNYYAVVLKKSEAIIGHLYFEKVYGDVTFEIGWVFRQDFQGFGYAFESAKALLNWGFQEKNCHRVVATCQPENTASFLLMEKLGMRREGHFKSCIMVDENTWWDEYAYGILATEWSQL